jgi:zinc protease
VHEWFQEYYGAANAVLVVAGDVDPDHVHERVQHYFGHIPSGPPLARQEAWVARRTGEQRARMEDRVPQARIYRVWNVPQMGTAEGDYLNLVSSVLTSGRNSRLYERLVYRDRIATDVSSFVYQGEIAGLFIVMATAQPGGDLAEVERALDEELARLLDRGVSRSELERVKVGYRAGFTRGIERIGGFGGISDVLAQGEVYFRDPAQYRVRLDRIAGASVSDVNRVARRWLDDGVFNLEVHPFPEYRSADAAVERAEGPPMPAEFPTIDFPAPQRATLSNGLRVQLVQRDAIPVVNFSLVLDAGYAADQSALPGTASMVGAMLSEGTRRRNSLQISDQLQRLGATLNAGTNLDMSFVSMSALRENLDGSLDIFADVVLNPSFPETEFDRLRQQRLAQIQRERVTPVQMALRVMPGLMYGNDHAYGMPLTGSGTTESVNQMSVESLRAFHGSWFRPNNATMVVVGDITMEDLQPRLERLFRGWEQAEVPVKHIGEVAHRGESTVYIIDRPQSQQSIIFAGHVAPPKANDDEIAIMAMNDALGGSFTSRINMNLREQRGWAYGAFSFMMDARGQRPFIAYAPVQSDRTADSMQEIFNELTGVIGDAPVTAEELAKVVDDRTKSLPGRWETGNSVAGSLIESIRFGYDDDYWDVYAQRFLDLEPDDLHRAAAEVVRPDRLIWVVVGDRASIEEPVRALGFGDIRFLDADGNPIE